jgi:spore maturation protein CgeB
MRWLVAHPGAQFSTQDVYNGWVEALTALGETVRVFNLGDRLNFYTQALLPVDAHTFRSALPTDKAVETAAHGIYAALYLVRPHVLLVISGMFLDPEVYVRARQQGTRVVLIHTESPYEDDRQLEQAQHCDLNLLNDPTNIERFREVAPTLYVPHAYRPAVHHPGPAVPEYECDLAFVGTGYPSRMRFFEQMDLDGLDVMLAGHWQYLDADSPLRRYVAHDPEECLDNTRAVDIYRSARIGMNLYRREAQTADLVQGWAMGPREVEMAACGLFFMRDPRPESDEVPGHASDLRRPAGRRRAAALVARPARGTRRSGAQSPRGSSRANVRQARRATAAASR